MDYLADPALLLPILVVAFYFLTSAGFWIYFCRQMSSFETGKLFFNSWLWRTRCFLTLSFAIHLF